MNKAIQTRFWEGEFGDTYTDRNKIEAGDRSEFFSNILYLTGTVSSVLELGANRGHNLDILHHLKPDLELTGVEVNKKACNEMAAHGRIKPVCCSIQEFKPAKQYDLVFTCGVLIHLPPDDLPEVYKKMLKLSRKYILINEYFNPTPVEVPYRGHSGRLFKRDWGSELIDAAEGNISLVDYGFLWKKVEPAWDNATWWLFEKK
ncbi:MAG: pseudaminic acid biosynthesis-associated methylase [Candidatus Rifleibacteriota bacterium]